MRPAFAVSSLLVLAVACQRPAAAPPVTPEKPMPRDLEEVMVRTRLAFWPEGERFVGGSQNYLARVDADGVSFQPKGSRAAGLLLGRTSMERGGKALATPTTLRRNEDGLLERVGEVLVEVLENTDRGLEQSWRLASEPAGKGDLVVRVPVSEGTPEAREDGLHFELAGRWVHYGHGTWIDATGRRTELPVSWESGAVTMRVPSEVVAQSRYPVVLDPLISAELRVGEPLKEPLMPSFAPAVGTNGSVFLVVWQVDGRGLRAARFGLDGTSLDPIGFDLGFGGDWYDSFWPSVVVASNGSDFLVALSGACSGSYAVRVSSGGQVADTAPIVLNYGCVGSVAATWTGTHWAVATIEIKEQPLQDNVFVQLITPTGTLGLKVAVTNRNNPDPQGSELFEFDGLAIAAAPAQLLVLYRKWTTATIEARRFSLNLAPLDATPKVVAQDASSAPRVSWDGQRFAIAWQASGTRLLLARMTTAGVIVDQPPVVLDSDVTSLSLSQDSLGAFLAWTGWRGARPILAGVRLFPHGGLSSSQPTIIHRGQAVGAAFYDLSLASASTHHLALWLGERAEALRFDSSGHPLDPAPWDPCFSVSDQARLALAQRGDEYLAAWEELGPVGWRVLVNPLGRDGRPRNRLGVPVPTNRSSGTPQVAANGERWLVTWQESINSTDIVGAIYRSDAGWLADASVLAGGPGIQSGASVAPLGDSYALAYVNGSSSTADLYVSWVSADGLVEPDAGVELARAPGEQSGVRLAAGDGGLLAVWTDRRDGGTNVIAARIEPGSVVDPQGFPIADLAHVERNPNVAWNGEHYLVCWEDVRTGPTLVRVLAARVSPSTGLIDDGGIPAVQTNLQAVAGRCAPVWDGEAFLVAFSPGFQWNNARIVGTWISASGDVRPDAGTLLVSPMEALARSVTSTALVSRGFRQVLLGYSVENSREPRVAVRLITRGAAPTLRSVGALTTPEDVPLDVTLVVEDDDGDPAWVELVSQPDAGAASVTGATLRVTPARDFAGPLQVVLVADDGALRSQPLQLEVLVTPVDDVPVALPVEVETDEDVAVEVVVPDVDVDGEALTVEIDSPPAHGAVSGQPPRLLYAPAPDFFGMDRFSYRLRDAANRSEPAEVRVLVRPLPDPPRASDARFVMQEDAVLDFELTAVDVDGDPLSFALLTSPGVGALTGAAPSLRFTPPADFHGEVSFRFSVSDGASSDEAEVSIVVEPVNDAPVASDSLVAVRAGEPVDVVLVATDVDGEPLRFEVTQPPSHGSVSGEPPRLVYQPDRSHAGEDRLVWRAIDAAGASAEAVVRFEVIGVTGGEPGCGCSALSPASSAALLALLLAVARRRLG